jgi:hypothetical protein
VRVIRKRDQLCILGTGRQVSSHRKSGWGQRVGGEDAETPPHCERERKRGRQGAEGEHRWPSVKKADVRRGVFSQEGGSVCLNQGVFSVLTNDPQASRSQMTHSLTHLAAWFWAPGQGISNSLCLLHLPTRCGPFTAKASPWQVRLPGRRPVPLSSAISPGQVHRAHAGGRAVWEARVRVRHGVLDSQGCWRTSQQTQN